MIVIIYKFLYDYKQINTNKKLDLIIFNKFITDKHFLYV